MARSSENSGAQKQLRLKEKQLQAKEKQIKEIIFEAEELQKQIAATEQSLKKEKTHRSELVKEMKSARGDLLKKDVPLGFGKKQKHIFLFKYVKSVE